MNSGEFQFVEVELIEPFKIHYADELLLLGDSEPVTVTISKAQKYWLGVSEASERTEVLYEGRLRVIRILS
jgi:hypothetical protein